jgi:hypothetical protein
MTQAMAWCKQQQQSKQWSATGVGTDNSRQPEAAASLVQVLLGVAASGHHPAHQNSLPYQDRQQQQEQGRQGQQGLARLSSSRVRQGSPTVGQQRLPYQAAATSRCLAACLPARFDGALQGSAGGSSDHAAEQCMLIHSQPSPNFTHTCTCYSQSAIAMVEVLCLAIVWRPHVWQACSHLPWPMHGSISCAAIVCGKCCFEKQGVSCYGSRVRVGHAVQSACFSRLHSSCSAL